MAKTQTLHAEPRKRTGSGSLKQMRREGWLPCVVYGRGLENRNLKLDSRSFGDLLARSASSNILVNLEIGGEATVLAFLQATQHDPLTDKLLHVDFRAIDDATEITAHLPIELTGESVGVKAGGVLDHVLHSLDIRCLPKDLPELIKADVSDLEVGDFLHVGDLQLPPGVSAGPAPDVVVVHVAKTRVAEEEVAAAPAEPESGAEPEVVGRRKEEE